MRAALLSVDEKGTRRLLVHDSYPKPKPGPGEVLLRVVLAGICDTDLEIMQGYKSMSSIVLGHEFVARIEEFGPDCDVSDYLKVGDRVVAEINCVPPGSKSRNAYERAQDPDRTALGIFGHDGAFADFVCVPPENIHKVPDSITDIEALFIEPLAAACQILEQVFVGSSQNVAVVGAGRLGWLVAQTVLTRTNKVTMFSVSSQDNSNKGYLAAHESNEELAKDLGVKLVSLTRRSTLRKSFELSFDIVVDCSFKPWVLEYAVQMVKPRGSVLLKSATSPTKNTNPIDLSIVVVNEIQVIGSRCGPFTTALKLLKDKTVNPLKLPKEIKPLESITKAFDITEKVESLKVILQLSETSCPS